LEITRDAIFYTITTLNNTLPNNNFSELSLNSQKISFSSLRSVVAATLSSAQSMLDNLENLDLRNKQQTDGLYNALKNAENQLELAQISYNNAKSALESAQQAKNQQIIGARASLDNTTGQLSLVGSQVADLNIKASIAGQIVAKYVEAGNEVTPGQKIAQVVQSDLVKVLVDLSSEDIYKIKLGQIVFVNDSLKATVSNISPAADAVTKKVRVEVVFDNKDKELIPETFVKVSLPVMDTENIKTQNHENTENTEITKTQIVIPLKALIISQTEKYVFVNRDGVAKKINVEISDIEGENVVILSDLILEDELVIDGAKNLEDGQEIIINNQ